jgi:hypothetical protein
MTPLTHPVDILKDYGDKAGMTMTPEQEAAARAACDAPVLTPEQIKGYGYECPKQFPSGEWAALRGMAFTVAICIGLDESGYARRFCYPDALSALLALAQWDGVGDPPGPWLVEKGGPIPDRRNPARFKGVPIVLDGEGYGP